MSCVVRWWHVLFVKGVHFSIKNARLLNYFMQIDLKNLFKNQNKLKALDGKKMN